MARTGDLAAAEDPLGKALAAGPEFALAYDARGVVRSLRGRWDLALVDLTRATELAPDLADAHA